MSRRDILHLGALRAALSDRAVHGDLAAVLQVHFCDAMAAGALVGHVGVPIAGRNSNIAHQAVCGPFVDAQLILYKFEKDFVLAVNYLLNLFVCFTEYDLFRPD